MRTLLLARATLICVTIAVLFASAPAAAAVLPLPAPLDADTAPLLVARGALAHGATVALGGGDGSALRDSATGNGRDLNVVQLNQISHLVDSLDRLRTGIDRTQEASPQETVASV